MTEIGKSINAKNIFVEIIRGMGGVVDEKNGLIVVKGLNFQIDKKGPYLYIVGLTVHPVDYGIIAIQVGKEVYLY